MTDHLEVLAQCWTAVTGAKAERDEPERLLLWVNQHEGARPTVAVTVEHTYREPRFDVRTYRRQFVPLLIPTGNVADLIRAVQNDVGVAIVAGHMTHELHQWIGPNVTSSLITCECGGEFSGTAKTPEVGRGQVERTYALHRSAAITTTVGEVLATLQQ